MQNILSDLRDKWEFTHHDRLVKGRGVAAHDTQEGENKQTILYTFLLFLAAVSGDLDFFCCSLTRHVLSHVVFLLRLHISQASMAMFEHSLSNYSFARFAHSLSKKMP